MREHILLKAIYQDILIIRKNQKTKVCKKTRIIWRKFIKSLGIESTFNGIEAFSVFCKKVMVQILYSINNSVNLLKYIFIVFIICIFNGLQFFIFLNYLA